MTLWIRIRNPRIRHENEVNTGAIRINNKKEIVFKSSVMGSGFNSLVDPDLD
jgi:hypothetical protein